MLKLPLPKGTQFPITLHLNKDSEPMEIECEVVWVRTETDDPGQHPVGMGVKFIDISRTDRQFLINEIKRTHSGDK